MKFLARRKHINQNTVTTAHDRGFTICRILQGQTLTASYFCMGKILDNKALWENYIFSLPRTASEPPVKEAILL